MSSTQKSGGPREALSPLKQAFLALDRAETRIRELEGAAAEPIAIVGIGCRIPGAESGPEDFWRLLKDEQCAVSDRVTARMATSGYMDLLPEAARRAALLERVDLFDPRHFGISPREAVGMDPQQRLLLEASWEALENAGIDPTMLYQTPTGVFVGIAAHDYMQLQVRHADLSAIDPHFASGSSASVAAGRISYVLGLNGPAMSIDTACSSSLVAVHLACESLRRNECATALSAGVNLILSAEALFAFAESGMLSPRGFCSAFDALADGFVRGEGCGVVVLKRLRDAESSGDRIQGVILGSAVNQDGASSGLTVPNGLAQQALLREAQRRAGIEPWQVGYVEAHGTGTTLGDPIEAEALGAVFAGREGKLGIGSVKTNLGHLESAAGIAGLIKVVLSLEHGEIPAQLHWSGPSEHVRWGELPLEVVTEARAWEPIGGRRIGGVSSFGLSGTNAHVVVEGWKRPESQSGSDAGAEALVLSARTEAALRELAKKYAGYLETSGEWSWREICATAGMGRAAMAERLSLVAESREAAGAKLRRWLEGKSGEVYRRHVGAGHRGGAAVAAEASPETVAGEFVKGGVVDWRGRGAGLRRAALPTYAFQRERYWVASGAEDKAGRGMLGRRLEVAGTRGVFETQLTASGWIGEHRVEGQAVLPATGHVELMLEAGAEIGGCGLEGLLLEEVVLEARLTVDGERRVQTVVEEETGGRSRVRVYAESGAGWERVSEGWLRQRSGTDARPDEEAEQIRDAEQVRDAERIQSRLEEIPAGETFYAAMARRGVSFGERFRGVRRLWSGEGEALGEIVATEAAGAGWQTAPWWLDACLQPAGGAAGDELYLPLSIERVEFRARPQERVWSHMRSRRIDENTLAADLDIFASDGLLIATLRGIRFRKITSSEAEIDSLLYGVEWRAAELRPNRLTKKVLLIGEGELASNLARHLANEGIETRHLLAEQLADEDGISGFEAMIWTGDGMKRQQHDFSAGATAVAEKSLCSLLATVQWLARQKMQARLYVVTRGACAVLAEDRAVRLEETPLLGMAAAVATEIPELRCTRLDADGSDADLSSIAVEVLADADERQVAWRNKTRYTARLERRGGESQWFSLRSPVQLTTSGGIDGLAWAPVEQRERRRDLGADEVEIEVRAATLNFHDVLQVLGVIADEGTPGADCAGVVLRTGEDVIDLSPGDEVVAVAGACFASRVIASRSLVVRKPPELTFAESTAQTIAYLTAAYCLEETARLQPGETVLIHAAAGGVGLAAVHLCHRIGARVIATAGSEKKREYLRSLGIEQVYDSRSAEFASKIGSGVDVVLNSLAGEAVDAGLALLNRGGRFVEMGRTDLRDPAKISGERPGVKYIPVDLTPLITGRSPWVRGRMAKLFEELNARDLPLIPVTAFRALSVKDAFRYMARAAHIGRVVVETSGDSSGAHVVTGGMSGIGLRTAEWLAGNGATSLVLVGRSEPDAAARLRIEEMRASGAEVRIVRGDIGDPGTAARAVECAGPRLSGVWHAAGVLENLAVADQTWESICRVMRPKADGAWNLHVASLGAKLKYFVLYSSWASIGGAHGQLNYCGANAFLDGLAHFRHSQGLPALSVNWGAWQQTGMTSDAAVQRRLARSGMEAMTPDDALEALDRALEWAPGAELSQTAIAAIRWPRYLAHSADSKNDPFYSEVSPRKPHVKKPSDQQSARLSSGVGETQLRAGTRGNGYNPAGVFSDSALFRTVGDILRRTLELHPGEEIDPEIPLGDLGIDSLLAVEVRNGLAATFQLQLPPTLLFDYPTVRSLVKYLSPRLVPEVGNAEEISAVIAVKEIAGPDKPLDLLNAIEQMADEEVESLLGRDSRA